MDVAAVHVDGEAGAYPGDAVQERPPSGHVEELRDELAPVGEPGPVEVGDADAQAREARDMRQRELGPCEARRSDDEAVGERHEIIEVPGFARRRPGPPQEHGQIRNEQRDHDACDALVEVAAHAREDLLVQHDRRAVGLWNVAMQLYGREHALAIAIGEEDDRAGWMPKCEIRHRPRGPARMDLALGVDNEIEYR